MYLPQISTQRTADSRRDEGSPLSSVQQKSHRSKSKKPRRSLKKNRSRATKGRQLRSYSAFKKEQEQQPKRPSARANLNLAYKTLINRRETTSDTAFRFWHENFTNYPRGAKIETLQFLPKSKSGKNIKKKVFKESEKLIDKKFFMTKPKKFLEYYSRRYELERAKPFIKPS